ncbi:putative inactive deoxyuridine 5'-triphosphate nucleotidohydrolase-like protein FLJ16323 [Dasypus novemcinctus]|uniref:putative inactive deoxyuridine 5'-triphosphate nucleotidohydrolase-like protein FLJ16323 n=1 Tax=Dasypus novemcinctus TaxID=9361 RepID=UPI0039C943D3
MILLNWKLRVQPGHLGLFFPLNQWAKKEITVLAGVIDPDYQGEIGLHLHNGGKEEFACNTGDPLGCFLVLPYPEIKVNGKLQQLNQNRTNNGPECSGMKILITPPGKESWPAEVLLKVTKT